MMAKPDKQAEERESKLEAAKATLKTEVEDWMPTLKTEVEDWIPKPKGQTFFKIQYRENGVEQVHTAAGAVVEGLKEWLADANRTPYFQVRVDADG